MRSLRPNSWLAPRKPFARGIAGIKMRVVGRLGLAAAKEFGLGWEDCEKLHTIHLEDD
jgi:hypothetical protein